MAKNKFATVQIEHDSTGEQFEKLHQRGAKEFGSAWLAANMAAAEHAGRRTDVANRATKELVSIICLAVLSRLRSSNHLVNVPPEGGYKP